MARSTAVDAWFEDTQPVQTELMQAVRTLVLACDDRIEESIKWRTPTFSYQGNIFSFNPAKKLVSLLFHRGAEIPGSHPKLEGDGKLARTFRFADMDEFREHAAALEAVVAAWIAMKDA